MTSAYLATDAIQERLRDQRAVLKTQLAGIPAELQNRPREQGRWSIAEVLEHLVRIETGVIRLLQLKGQVPPGTTLDEPPEGCLGSPELGLRVRDRTRTIDAPERVRPTGTIAADAALAQLELARGSVLDAFAAADPVALDRQTHPHPVFGDLTLRSWVALIADHEARHTAQIAEIAAELEGTA